MDIQDTFGRMGTIMKVIGSITRQKVKEFLLMLMEANMLDTGIKKVAKNSTF